MEVGGSGGGVRLHVGGLGESVGRDDLLKIFSPMGSVDSVEFVRTKGRSFAYIDFSPSSENSLTKLFSTYNGCIWKGGKLRLEKAKEHYLARLKREWEESSPSSVSDDTVKTSDNSEPSTHLNIFFPRLRKVKALPLSGTGKHKYSFQRVLVPSLPKNFCDCEEHSTSLTPRENHVRDLEALNVGGINEEEVNIMNSVMTKLFEKNNLPISEKVPVEDISEQVPEEDSEIEADQDNLIINVGSSGKDMMNLELDLLSRKRKSTLDETTASGEGYTKELKGNKVQSSKKRKSVILEGSVRQESSQVIPEKKKASEVVLDKASDEPSRTVGVKRSSDSISWSQKSSWKALVANGNSSDFSVSSFLPGISSSKAVQPASHSTDLAGLPSRENSEALDVPRSTVKTKIKKTKSKGLTSTIMAGNLPAADDIEMNDTTDNDDVGSDHSEDTNTDTSVEAESLELDSSTEVDSENDDLNVEDDEDVAEDLNADKESSVLKDNEDHDVGDEEAGDFPADDDIEMNDTIDHDAVGSVHSEDTDTDTSVEAEPLELEASTEGDSENGNLNVENDEDVAEDLSAEKESSILKDDEDHDVGEEKAGKGPLEACSKSTAGSSWLQRASWTQLASDKNASFSLTQLFPDLKPDKCESAKEINNGDGQSFNSNQSESGMKQRDETSGDGFKAAGVHVASGPVRSLQENWQSLNGKNASEGISRLGVKKPIIRKVGSGETCTFMRSSTSLKEWAKAKKALSEPRRRNRSEEE